MAKITYDQLLTLYKKKGIANDTKAKTAFYKELTENKGIQVDMPTPTKAPIGIMERASMVGQQRGDQGKQAAASFGKDTGANFMKGATQAISGLGQLGEGISQLPYVGSIGAGMVNPSAGVASLAANVARDKGSQFSSKDIGLAAQKLFSGAINVPTGALGAAFSPVTTAVSRTPLQQPLETAGKAYMDVAGMGLSAVGIEPQSEFGEALTQAPLLALDALGLKGASKAGKLAKTKLPPMIKGAESALPKVGQSLGAIGEGVKRGGDVLTKYVEEQAGKILPSGMPPIKSGVMSKPGSIHKPQKIAPSAVARKAEMAGITPQDVVDIRAFDPYSVPIIKQMTERAAKNVGKSTVRPKESLAAISAAPVVRLADNIFNKTLPKLGREKSQVLKAIKNNVVDLTENRNAFIADLKNKSKVKFGEKSGKITNWGNLAKDPIAQQFVMEQLEFMAPRKNGKVLKTIDKLDTHRTIMRLNDMDSSVIAGNTSNAKKSLYSALYSNYRTPIDKVSAKYGQLMDDMAEIYAARKKVMGLMGKEVSDTNIGKVPLRMSEVVNRMFGNAPFRVDDMMEALGEIAKKHGKEKSMKTIEDTLRAEQIINQYLPNQKPTSFQGRTAEGISSEAFGVAGDLAQGKVMRPLMKGIGQIPLVGDTIAGYGQLLSNKINAGSVESMKKALIELLEEKRAQSKTQQAKKIVLPKMKK